MTTKAISPLRQRMTDEMTMRRMSWHTQQGYIRAVKRFADFFGRYPDKVTAEDIRRFHVHQAKRSSMACCSRPPPRRRSSSRPTPTSRRSHRDDRRAAYVGDHHGATAIL